MLKKILRRFSEVHCGLSSLENGIKLLTLQREKPKNALGRVLVSQLTSHLEALSLDEETRAVIINSSIPGMFCSGADLKERSEMTGQEVLAFVRDLRESFNMIESLPVPTIACIEGYALGGGLELALACDLRVVLSDCIVGLPETSLAIIPGAGGTQRLSRLIGLGRAKEMIFTAVRYKASDLKDYGLFNFIGDNPYHKALEMAQNIASNGPVGVRMAKKAIDVGFGSKDCMEVERLCYSHTIPTQDRLEALQAFKEKRKPVYKGK